MSQNVQANSHLTFAFNILNGNRLRVSGKAENFFRLFHAKGNILFFSDIPDRSDGKFVGVDDLLALSLRHGAIGHILLAAWVDLDGIVFSPVEDGVFLKKGDERLRSNSTLAEARDFFRRNHILFTTFEDYEGILGGREEKQEETFVERQPALRVNKKMNKHFAQFTANERFEK